ncbi:MAG: hypothetical protein KKB37_17440 [Alphaproteobacteria bacterium]|nr:hypothetical protein [Alphaproteobacteria bacterium]
MFKHDFIVGVPYSGCKFDSIVPCTREDEALAMAFGAYLCGKNPLVFMQNAGLGHCLDFITSILMPGDVEIPLVINNRTSPKHHEILGYHTENILELLGYRRYTLE